MTGQTETTHDSATIEGDVTLADDVVIGPNCVFDGTVGPISIGRGCRFVANCYVTGPLRMGEDNTVWPGATLGGPPQDVGFDPLEPGAGIEIGSRNVFREGSSAHRAKTDSPTRIGDDNYLMSCSHIGHDSQVGNRIQLANGALLAGHVTMGDRVIMGGGAGVHQFCRVGEGVFFRGLAGASMVRGGRDQSCGGTESCRDEAVGNVTRRHPTPQGSLPNHLPQGPVHAECHQTASR